MIKNSKQNWTVGAVVKVGFHSLKIRAICQTPGDGLPDAYILTNLAESRLYKFIPHNGLIAIDHEEAEAMLVAEQRRVAADIDRRYALSETRARINSLFGV